VALDMRGCHESTDKKMGLNPKNAPKVWMAMMAPGTGFFKGGQNVDEFSLNPLSLLKGAKP